MCPPDSSLLIPRQAAFVLPSEPFPLSPGGRSSPSFSAFPSGKSAVFQGAVCHREPSPPGSHGPGPPFCTLARFPTPFLLPGHSAPWGPEPVSPASQCPLHLLGAGLQGWGGGEGPRRLLLCPFHSVSRSERGTAFFFSFLFFSVSRKMHLVSDTVCAVLKGSPRWDWEKVTHISCATGASLRVLV